MNLNRGMNKTHYPVREIASDDGREQQKREGLTLDFVKFCDGLMLSLDRRYDFVSAENVTCKKCNNKIERLANAGVSLP